MEFFYLFIGSFALSLIFNYPLLLILRWLRARQNIREEGPSSHIKKTGTPTLGGIGFVLIIAGLSFLVVDERYLPLLLLFLGFALIGLIDDLVKLFRRHNLGLTFWQKILFQTLLASLFSIYLIHLGHAQDIQGLLHSMGFSAPILYFLLLTFMLVGSANATNLTDGLDGLLSGCSFITFLAYALVCYKLMFYGGAAFALICAGAVLGFLFYNFPRAKVFMGDLGSLSLGVALAGLAILTHKELLLAIIGGVFVLEALSVILQVLSFKLFKTRILKMSPLHHHFELCGMSELKVVLFFWSMSLILGVIGVVFYGI